MFSKAIIGAGAAAGGLVAYSALDARKQPVLGRRTLFPVVSAEATQCSGVTRRRSPAASPPARARATARAADAAG